MFGGMIFNCKPCGFTRRTDWPARKEQKMCPNCHQTMRGKIIEAIQSEGHICDSRCMLAKGHTCNCSCNGKNHGAAYA